MTNDELIKGDDVNYGSCRGCGHDLVPSTQGQPNDLPNGEIVLECSMLGTNECVAGESFLISELID